MTPLRRSWWGLAALGVAACSAGGPAVELGPPELVSGATAHGAAPMLFAGADGSRLLSWVANGPGGREALYVEVTDASGGARLAAPIADSLGGIAPHGEAPPRLSASPDGALYALYTVGREVPGHRFPRSALRLVRSEDGGRSWSEPISVNEGERFGSHNFHALLAGPDGAVWASWLSSTGEGSAVWLRRSVDGGRRWDPALQVHSSEACPCCRTGLARDKDGSLYLSWRSVFDDGARDVVVARSPDGGRTWEPPVRPREDGWVVAACPHAGPSLAVDSAGAVHIAWWTGKTGEAGVYYARSTDQGRSFRAQPIATGARSAPAHVQVAAGAAGQVVVAWDDGLGPIPRILVRASVDGGQSFGFTVTASDDDRSATFPVLAVAGDSVLVTWGEMGAAPHHHGTTTPAAAKDAPMPLPRVGQSEVYLRRGRIVSR